MIRTFEYMIYLLDMDDHLMHRQTVVVEQEEIEGEYQTEESARDKADEVAEELMIDWDAFDYDTKLIDVG